MGATDFGSRTALALAARAACDHRPAIIGHRRFSSFLLSPLPLLKGHHPLIQLLCELRGARELSLVSLDHGPQATRWRGGIGSLRGHLNNRAACGRGERRTRRLGRVVDDKGGGLFRVDLDLRTKACNSG